jgi:hypothetical protein
MEARASRSGRRLSELSKEELEEFWEIEKAKAIPQVSSGTDS